MSTPTKDLQLATRQADDIKHGDKGSILRPLKSWAFFGRPPVTEPLEPRLASANYRGFHLNDWEKCIGCSTCQKVCDNAAITMVQIPDLPSDPVKGIRNERPAIDYGRCCWCGLCVDICPTGSISLSREYVHTCTEDQIDSYFVLPDPNGMHGKFFGHGWSKTPDADLVDLHRQPMAEMEADQRGDNFNEIVAGFSDQEALLEASRCVQCGMCHDACPTHMDAPEYIRSIWEGNLEGAVEWIYQSNPFSHVCGRVCTHRCEDACSIGRRGEAIAIRWLKRYAMDAVGHDKVKEIATRGKAKSKTGRKIAIIGSGPAGLTTAYDLARMGHQVTVFEAQAKPGGMPRYGIPEYRLPYDKLDQDIEIVEAMGVEIRCNTKIGQDISFDQLQQDHDSVVLALGLWMGRSTRIPNSDKADTAIDLLRRITDGEALDVPKQAVVIGGGNVAMDIARSLARLQRQQHGKVGMTVTAMEDFDHFLADPAEVKESLEEGIKILDARGPQDILLDDAGQIAGLRTWKVKSIFDEQGRFAPSFDEADEQLHFGSMVVEAIGQMSNTELLSEAITEQLEWRRGRLVADEDGRTALPWLFAAGDMVHGPDVVHAVADGHKTAAAINVYLESLMAKAS